MEPVLDFIRELLKAPFDVLLMVAGLLLTILAIVGRISSVDPGKSGRIAAAIVGPVFLILGLYLHPGILTSKEKTLMDDAKSLEDTVPSPSDSWIAFGSDYNWLADITRRYLQYVQGHPGRDAGNKVFDALIHASNKLRTRNEKLALTFDPSGWHSKDALNGLDGLLETIPRHREESISKENEACYEAALSRWLSNARIGANAPPNSVACQAYLNISW